MSNEPNLQASCASNYISTGVPGFDAILKGGFVRGGTYLLQGNAGTGKTTLGLQYLREQARQGERVLLIALTETRRDIESICKSHGWSSKDIVLFEPWRASSDPVEVAKTSIFDPADSEFGDIIQAIISEIERVEPSHLVLDGLAELRLSAGSQIHFRRQLVCLKNFLEQRSITTLMFDDNSCEGNYGVHHAVVSASISLEFLLPQYGRARRRLHVGKVRSSAFLEGFHDYEIGQSGIFAYPRLQVPERSEDNFPAEMITSGIETLDRMLMGGLPSGSSAIFIGPSGVGKSSLAMQFVANALKHGKKAAVFSFDEILATFLQRAERLSFVGEANGLKPYLEDGRLLARQVDPAELTPGSFAQVVIDAVDAGASIVVIDSLNGYANAMPEERLLSAHLHQLVSCLNLRNVLTIMVVAQHGIMKESTDEFNVSYLSDHVLSLRYVESGGTILRGVVALKKRTGGHEFRVRELSITDTGIVVGKPMSQIKKTASVSLDDDTAFVESYVYNNKAQDKLERNRDAKS